ncbi:MAG: hypothetical protein P4M11_07705 [Candidatus Pacebacteria bacterium]|nr:hypothetical protein [Candidatus Paceibacterota bacterium]
MIKGLIDMCAWYRRLICSPFFIPSLISLVQRATMSIFLSMMTTVMLGLSMVSGITLESRE